MIQTALRVLLAASVVIVGGIGMSMVTAQESASDTYVHNVGPLIMHSEGQVCIEEMSETVNKVTLTDTTHFSTEFYHYDTAEDVFIDVPKLNSNWIVLYTNGSNPLVDQLASLGKTTGQPFCTPPGMDVQCSITLDEYNISTTVRTSKGLDVVGGPDAAANPPRPRDSVTEFVEDGCVSADLLNNSSASTTPQLPVDPGETPVDETVDNATDTVNTTTKLVNGTVANTTAPVDGAVTNSTDAVDEPVNNTTAQVDDIVSNVTDEANGTETPVEEVVQTTVETVQKTVAEVVDTVSNATNVSNNTTAEPTEVPTITVTGSDGGALSVAAWAARHV